MSVFADEVIHAATLPAPVWIFPGPAHGRHILQPGCLRSVFSQFIPVAELMSAASALDTEQAVFAGHGTSFFPILAQSPDIAYVRCDSGDGRQKEVIFPPAAQVKSKAAFGKAPQEQRSPLVQSIKERREFAVGDALDEKLQNVFVGRRTERIRAFNPLAVQFNADGGVLPCKVGERAARIYVKKEKVVRN